VGRPRGRGCLPFLAVRVAEAQAVPLVVDFQLIHGHGQHLVMFLFLFLFLFMILTRMLFLFLEQDLLRQHAATGVHMGSLKFLDKTLWVIKVFVGYLLTNFDHVLGTEMAF
jgi:hypothetical protein